MKEIKQRFWNLKKVNLRIIKFDSGLRKEKISVGRLNDVAHITQKGTEPKEALTLQSPNLNSFSRKSIAYVKQNLSINATFSSTKLSNFLLSKRFSLFISLLVLLNIIVLILGYSVDTKHSIAFICEIFQLILTIIFSIEMALKILVFGVETFFSNQYNLFDFLIILLNFIEILYEIGVEDNLFMPTTQSGPGIKSLKFLRIFHFIVVLDYWKIGAMLFKETANTIAKTINFIAVIFIFILLATLYGRQIFSYTIRILHEKVITTNLDNASAVVPRLHYDSFLDSVMSTTLIFLNEEWHVIMFQYMRAFGGQAAIYFVLVLLGGSVLLMKMFIALFINNFLNSKSIKKLILKQPFLKRIYGRIKEKMSGSPIVQI